MESLLEIKTEIREGFGLLHLTGDVTGDAGEALTAAQNELPEHLHHRLVLDLEHTQYINSAGIAAFIGLMNRVHETGGKLRLAAMNKHFKKVIETVGLSDYIEIFTTIEEALKE